MPIRRFCFFGEPILQQIKQDQNIRLLGYLKIAELGHTVIGKYSSHLLLFPIFLQIYDLLMQIRVVLWNDECVLIRLRQINKFNDFLPLFQSFRQRELAVQSKIDIALRLH
ncbi:hypothetical protein D3C78_951410 [compost metagenome]